VINEESFFNQPVAATHDARAVHKAADCCDVHEEETLIMEQGYTWRRSCTGGLFPREQRGCGACHRASEEAT
jgi:hypothetical protein